MEHGALAPLGGGRCWLPGQGAGAGVQGAPDRGGLLQRGDRQRRGCDPVQRADGLIGRGEVAGTGVERPREQGPAQQRGVGGAASLPDQRDRDGGQSLGDRPAGDRGQVRPLEVSVGAGVLIPGQVAGGGVLWPGDGQPGGHVERHVVTDRVFEAGEEPFGDLPDGEGLAMRAAGDAPPDPPPAFGGVGDLLNVPEPDVVAVHAGVSSCCGCSRRRSHALSSLRRIRTPPPGRRTSAGPVPRRRQR